MAIPSSLFIPEQQTIKNYGTKIMQPQYTNGATAPHSISPNILERLHNFLPSDPLLPNQTHPAPGNQGCVWLGSRGSDGTKFLSLAGMLGDMLWGAVVPLVYCGCMSVDPECSLVCCFGLNDEEGIAIIHLLGPNLLQ